MFSENQKFGIIITRADQRDVILILTSETEIFTDSGHEAERALYYKQINKPNECC